ncbi:MAG: HAD family phosphatase [bacterium]|nr:HAD family phosphatase [bacterium]
MKNKAFIFDLDGVLIDSQSMWHKIERENFPALFGKEIADKMPNLVGAGVEAVVSLALSNGSRVSRDEILKKYDEMALAVYARSKITFGVEKLADKLIAAGIAIGIVTQSSRIWIDQMLPRLSFRKSIRTIVSIPDNPKLKGKPAPDGYLKAFKNLNANPQGSFILEDSNVGIQAGKASGAFTIGYRGNLLPGYEQDGADAYAFSMDDVIALIDRTTR